MNADATLVKCKCNYCSAHIEFDLADIDPNNPPTIPCPHCGMETRLYAPVPEAARVSPQSNPPKVIIRKRLSARARRRIIIACVFAIVCAYVIIESRKIAEILFEKEGLPIIFGMVVFALAFILGLLWLFFPVFVYFSLETMKNQNERAIRALEQIRDRR